MKNTILKTVILGLISFNAMAEGEALPQNINSEPLPKYSVNGVVMQEVPMQGAPVVQQLPPEGSGYSQNMQPRMSQGIPLNQPISNSNQSGPGSPMGQIKRVTFEECVFKASALLDFMDELRSLPEDKRVESLYNSVVWRSLNENQQMQALKFLAELPTIPKNKYKVIKGKMATDFLTECEQYKR